MSGVLAVAGRPARGRSRNWFLHFLTL
jgi:hypothetical protein